MAIDFGAINASLSAARVVPGWLPDGKREGNEWISRNPTRGDNKPGSFSINLSTGAWSDFATGDTGGDLVSLYAYLFHNRDQGAAARELQQRHTITPAGADVPKRLDDRRPEVVSPVPSSAPAPTFRHRRFGTPTTVFPYYDATGAVLLYVARFDPDGMRKQIVPRSWTRSPDGDERWRWQGPSGGSRRPLYGLDRLAAYPNTDVLVVEGEKTADAAQAIAGDAIAVVAWLGGTATADRVDLKPLRGRRVYLWPDADAQRERSDDGTDGGLFPFHRQPGVAAMLTIAGNLAEIAPACRMIGYTPGELPHGWDLADALDDGWDLTRLVSEIAERNADPFALAGGRAQLELDEAQPGVEPKRRDDRPTSSTPLSSPLNPFSFPNLSDKGAPLNTIANIQHLLSSYGITARYNTTAKRTEIDVPNANYTVDNATNCAMADLTSLCAWNRVPKGDLGPYVQRIADRNAYSPVADWIESVAWDGADRLQRFCETITTPADDTLRDVLIRRWATSAIAALYESRGVQAHGVLVLQGAQGTGKTSWFERLTPRDMRATLSGAHIDPLNKDTVILALSHWLVELGELEGTFRKADVARLKAFVTQGTDKIRQPYDRAPSEYPRRTVFFGSVNPNRYLVDDTGNRRWWTIPVTSIDYQHTIDMQQVWAQLLSGYRDGAQWWLTRDEQAELDAANAAHESIDPIEEAIRSLWAWDPTSSGRYYGDELTATEVLIKCGIKAPNRGQATQASRILSDLTNGPPRKTGSRRVFRMPARRGSDVDPATDLPF